MSTIEEIQEWYREQCNGDWEHTHGINIATLDNPGWRLEINLSETEMSDLQFQADYHHSDQDWLHCNVENEKFIAFCGPSCLSDAIAMFISIARHAN